MEFNVSYLIKLGVNKIYKNKTVFLLLAIGAIVFNVFGLVIDDIMATLFLTILLSCLIFLITGVITYFINLPLKRLQERYIALFRKMNFSSTNREFPLYIGEEETEYLKLIVFHSQIPLREWQNKQHLIATYFNCEIAKIENSPKNNNLVYLYLVKKPLLEKVLWEDEHMVVSNDLLSLGFGYEGLVAIDLNKTPHCFIAGETGSGKSNILKCLIYQSILKGHEIKLIDFKRGVAFAVFEEVVDIYSDYESVIIVLENLVKETNQRLDILRANKVDNISEYNSLVTKDKQLKRIVVFIDELAELMKTSDKETNKRITSSLETLTRISRAACINLILGIQRPDSTVINGQIKNNVAGRICGHFTDPEPSRIMLNNNLANQLPNNIKGRFLLKDNQIEEFQAFYFYLPCLNEFARSTIQLNIREKEETISKIPAIEKELNFNFDDIEI